MDYFKVLPVEITSDILSRLPAESVLDCKSVCKPWNNLISHHPSFSKLHLNRLNDTGKLGFLFRFNQFYYVGYNEKNSNIRRVHLTPPETNNTFGRINLTPQEESYVIVGSYNGLICNLNDYGCINICNPIIKEYVSLPKPRPIAHRDKRLFCGFGYVPVTGEYKVVRMVKLPKRREEPQVVEVEVYTLGSGNGWRYIAKLDSRIIITGQIGVFANGALHWLVNGGKVMAFDLADEVFHDIPLPPIPQRNSSRPFFNVIIRALGDNVMCVADELLEGVSTVDRWLLKKKNGLQVMKGEVDCNWVSLSKEFSLDARGMLPFSFTKSGAVLCIKYLAEHSTIHRYDRKSSSLKMLARFDKRFSQLPSPHMNTLISLKALGEENTSISLR